VAMARRVCDVGRAGDVVVSAAMRSLLVGSEFEFVERGEHELKGLPGRWPLFVVSRP
jgi:class 3 adenylate cyclase